MPCAINIAASNQHSIIQNTLATSNVPRPIREARLYTRSSVGNVKSDQPSSSPTWSCVARDLPELMGLQSDTAASVWLDLKEGTATAFAANLSVQFPMALSKSIIMST